MKRISPSAILAGLSLAVLAGVGAWAWSQEPERTLRWAFLVLFFPGLWLMAELAQVRGADRRIGDAIMRFNRCAISFGAWLLALKIGLDSPSRPRWSIRPGGRSEPTWAGWRSERG